MTVTEPLGMMRHQAGLPRVQVWRRDDADGLKRFAEAVESQDCRLLGQIQDAGRGRHFPGRNPEAIGASALPDDLSWTVPRALTAAEIRDLIEQIAESALASERLRLLRRRNLRRAWTSVPSVPVSAGPTGAMTNTAATGTAVSALSPILVTALRAACGTDFIVGLKLPGDDGMPGGIGPAEAGIIGDLLTRARRCRLRLLRGRRARAHAGDAHARPARPADAVHAFHQEPCVSG